MDIDIKAITDALRDDGDTYELPDGRWLRVEVEPDETKSINDYDSDGRIEFVDDTRAIRATDHPAPRPDGMDGRAVKLSVGRDGTAWWQPCPDAEYPTALDFRKERQRIADLLEYGFVGITVELLDGKDAYGNGIVRNVASLWGLEWDVMSSDYGRDVVGELVNEVMEADATTL